MKVFLVAALVCSSLCNAQTKLYEISGTLEKWHKITLRFEGELLSENDEVNPFLNYRLNVVFRNGETEYKVPGFFAADGNAANSGANNGKIWMVRFRPEKVGKWNFETFFRKGENIAVNEDDGAGDPSFLNGIKGSFKIADNTSSTNKNISKGRLKYVGERYLRYAETKEYFLKGGADSPENFLGYHEFDQTPPSHKYTPHISDWREGDPVWKDQKGKAIIGALNYLASEDMNAVYFLTMNVMGDGKDVWPWTSALERYRFDCSKLDQWEMVFDHMDTVGLMLHIVLQETENELLLDIGEMGVQRKLYLRELIARFSHHLRITWNLGEENGPVEWSPKGQNDEDRIKMLEFIKKNDPYQNYVALHTHSVPDQQEDILRPLLNNLYLDGPSIQVYEPGLSHEMTKKWIQESETTQKQWIATIDEIGPADVGAKPDVDDPNHDEVRGAVLWGNLMAGGAGVEWYFGYKYAHMDLNCEDWRSRSVLWKQTKIALDFFQEYLPFYEMHSADGLTDNKDDYVFVKNNSVYSVYMPEVKETMLNLSASFNTYSIDWYNPREGGSLQKGSLRRVKGGDFVHIGLPPEKKGDWVALLKAVPEGKKYNNGKMEVITFDALTDFKILEHQDAQFYRDESNGCLAIDAAKKTMRNKFAKAQTVYGNSKGLFMATLLTTAENDGESQYIVSINGNPLDTIVNPKVTESFKLIEHQLNTVYLRQGDVIEVKSNAVTNGKILENKETAFSRGRWNALKLVPEGISILERLRDSVPFEEKQGFLIVEAEAFHHKTNNGTKRDWEVISNNQNAAIADKTYQIGLNEANNRQFIMALPDTRVTHDDPLIHGENFFPIAGIGGVVSYKVKINEAGTYYVWVRAFSSGTEDNGVHVGINDSWPESGARIQWCENKNQWTWSSAQRMPENHCGTEKTISLNIPKEGEYVISFSMREDGFKMDSWIITKDSSFNPK